ncbi:hypothetical protein JCM33374_g988 [Metschnikowia sp. JCM 33374]|nr:hypothetical protein JCM33374_g988 [Metschnikowia sp. JCM 33374]
MVFLARLFKGRQDKEGASSALGEGISGKVQLYKNGSKCYVIKTYHSKEQYESRAEYKARVLHEYHLLASLEHVNIIKAFSSEVSVDGLTVKMCMEVGSVDLKTLLQRNRGLSSGALFGLWKQVCLGVQYLHGRGICHRDLKLDNLVMDQGFSTVKIIDFVTATECSGPVVGVVGSARYMAPEMASKISYEGPKVDIWSLGVILYYFITRKFLWRQAVHSDAMFGEYIKREGDVSGEIGEIGGVNGQITPEQAFLDFCPGLPSSWCACWSPNSFFGMILGRFTEIDILGR